jgi:hypothetical protein
VLMAASWSSPSSSIAAIPQAVAETIDSEEDARGLNSLRLEAKMPDVALPEKRKVGGWTLPLTTTPIPG